MRGITEESMEDEQPTMVRCPQCCDDPRSEPDERCALCKGIGKVNPATALSWQAQHGKKDDKA